MKKRQQYGLQDQSGIKAITSLTTLLLTSYRQFKRHLKTQCIVTTYAIQILLLTYKLTTNLRTGCDGMGIWCEKKMMTGQRNVSSMKQTAPDQEEDQRGPRARLQKRTVKHVN